MKKTLLAAALLSLVSGAASASSTMTLKWEHKLLDGRTDRPKFEFNHRMDNGFAFGFEQAWQYDRSKKELETGFAPEQYELTFKTDYQHRWGDRNEHQAGGVLDYQTKETANTVRAGAYYGYRVTRDFSFKTRARYAQNIDRLSLGDNPRYRNDYNKEMRFDLWLTYRWSDFTFVYDLIHLRKLSSEKNSSGQEQHTFDNNSQSAWEHEFSAEYRLPNARAHAFYGKFKLKQELLKNSHQNSEYDWYGKRDNAVEFGYKYRF